MDNIGFSVLSVKRGTVIVQPTSLGKKKNMLHKLSYIIIKTYIQRTSILNSAMLKVLKKKKKKAFYLAMTKAS